MTKKLYFLRLRYDLPEENNPWEPWYDKAFGFVVRAESEKQARELANRDGGAECGPVRNTVYRTGGDPWLDPEFSHCEVLTSDGDAGVIIQDFRSA